MIAIEKHSQRILLPVQQNADQLVVRLLVEESQRSLLVNARGITTFCQHVAKLFEFLLSNWLAPGVYFAHGLWRCHDS